MTPTKQKINYSEQFRDKSSSQLLLPYHYYFSVHLPKSFTLPLLPLLWTCPSQQCLSKPVPLHQVPPRSVSCSAPCWQPWEVSWIQCSLFPRPISRPPPQWWSTSTSACHLPCCTSNNSAAQKGQDWDDWLKTDKGRGHQRVYTSKTEGLNE